MAIVKEISAIKEATHMSNALTYIVQEKKTNELVTYQFCSGTTAELAKQFYDTRRFFNKNKKIIAHHYCQSFDPDDKLTARESHEIGKKLIEQIAPGWQIVLATHVDAGHIHNHFIINSVNPTTGEKWRGNKTTLKNLQDISDALCKAMDLSVIERKSKYKGIDQTTMQLAKKGLSWKVNLTKDLDTALTFCKNKKQFIDYLKSQNYEVNYSDSKITIKKIGEKKSIRVDTLSKQFGEKYKKDNLEKSMGYFKEQPKKDLTEKEYVRTPPPPSVKTEWEKLEEHYFLSNAPEPVKFPKWTVSKQAMTKNPFKFTLNLFKFLFKRRKKKKALGKLYTTTVSANYKKISVPQSPKKIFGNCKYNDIMKSQGKNITVKIFACQLPKIYNQSFFWSGIADIKAGTVLITLKNKNIDKLSTAIGMNDTEFFKNQSAIIHNNAVYSSIKSRAINSNDKIEYLIVSNEQCQILTEYSVPFAKFNKGKKCNIAFNHSSKNRIIKLLYPKSQPETEYQKNRKINNELKKISALNQDPLNYKIISKAEYENLCKNSTVNFAAFSKGGNFNIVYLHSQESEISAAMDTKPMTL